MFQTKKDVDKHCQEVFRTVKNEKDRNLRCLSIAQQYYNVRDYGSAKQYVTLYLSQKDDSPLGHKLLAQCYEGCEERVKALREYKYSLKLDSNQPELMLRVCQLIAEDFVIVDNQQAKYWLEKAEAHFPYHPSIFKLKQKLAVFGDGNAVKTMESIIMDELKARPKDPSANIKLLSFLIENRRVQEAYNKAFSEELTFVPTLQWYENGVRICKIYKTQFPNSINEDFFGNYLFVLDRTLALSVQDIKMFRKSIPECVSFLAKFDEVLSAASSLLNKSNNLPLLIDHMAGQFCYHTANILYRKVKRDENDVQEIGRFIAPLLLLSTSESFTINNYRKEDTVVARILGQCLPHNTYRISQAGFVLLSRCKDSQRRKYLENIFHVCVGNWRGRILEKVYTTLESKSLCKSSFFVNYAAFVNIPMEFPRGLMDNIEKFVRVTETILPASLHHLVWLGVQYLINSEKKSICDRLISLKFRSRSFESLQYAPSVGCTFGYTETLTKIDVDAFLYACAYCAESALHHQGTANKVSATQIFPADVSKLLCSPEQEIWWESAYRVANNTTSDGGFNRVRAVVQRGIEVIRLEESDALPLPLVILLGRTFVNKAAIEPIEDLASALETRALLYWKAALPQLEKMLRDEAYFPSVKLMFDYHGPAISKSEVIKLLDEGKRFLDMQLLKGSNFGNFFSNDSTKEYNVYTSSVQSSACKSFAGDLQATNVVDEEKLCTLLEQNTRIMDRLETLSKKQELLSTNQLQLYEIVSVLAKKIDVFVIDSLAQAVQPLSPQTSAVKTAVSTSQIEGPTYSSLGAPSQLGTGYQYPFPHGNIQTNFPMYPPTVPSMTSIGAYGVPSPYVAPPYLPPAPTSSLPPSSMLPQQSTLPTFDFLRGLSAPSLTLTNRTVTEPSKTTTTCMNSSLSIGSPLSSSNVNPSTSSTEAHSTPIKLSPFSSQNSTPMTAASNASPSHSFQIKLPELSTIIKSPSVQIPEESADSDDERRVVEHDPIPDFKPIIPLPDEITVTTGEENEDVLFESRVKLYRYADKEWKERGIGKIKILKNLDTGRVRILMRREIVHKICANHFLSADMNLTPMINSDRAWIYCAPDFANEEMVIEKLCIRFKTPEIAAEFKTIFDEYKTFDGVTSSPAKSKDIESTLQSPVVSPAADKSSVSTPAVSPPTQNTNSAPKKNIFAPPTSNVGEAKTEEIHPVPKLGEFSFKSATSNDTTTVATDLKPKFAGFTFNSTPILTSLNQEKPKTDDKSKSSPFTSFSFNVSSELFKPPVAGGSLFGSISSNTSASEVSKPNSSKDSSAPFSSFSNAVDLSNRGASSTVTPASEVSEHKNDTDTSLPFASVRDTIDFSSLSKTSAGTNAFAKSETFKGFAGAGSRVFNSFSSSRTAASTSPAVSAILGNIDSTEKASTTNSEDSHSLNTTEEEFVPTAEFAPVVPLPDLIEVKTGEEGLNLLYEEQCKLFRFVGKEWKERGSGKMKIFHDPKDGSVRMLMRRDQVHKVCCNQRITADVELSPMKTNNKAWTWSNQDYSEGELKSELFCIRFKTQELAEAFRKAFEDGQKLLSSATQSPVTSSNATEIKSLPSLAEQFKRDPNTWDCEVCYVRNPKEANCCTACTTPKDGVTTETSSSSSIFNSNTSSVFGTTPKTEFKFGIPATTCATTSLFSFGSSSDSSQVTPTTAATMLFNFGPTATADTTSTATNKPMFNFGSTALTTSSNGPGFSFETDNSKRVSGGSLFGSPTTNEIVAVGSKPVENISIFSGNPIKSESASTFSSFSFKLNENQPFTFGSRSTPNDISSELTNLYRQVPFLIRDKNDKLLFKSPAKLFRFASGEWEARGIGHVQILLNLQLKKCRLLMFREPAGVVACLNHYLQDGVTFATYDQRSWIWSATDFSEGEMICEKFYLVFEDDADASAFKTTLRNIDSVSTNGKGSSTDEVEFVSETQISEDDRRFAESLKLPSNYFAYKYSSKSCPGCPGCEQEDLQNNIINDESSEKLPTTLIPTSTEPADDTTNKPGFVFGASATSSWSKTSFNFNNLFANITKDSSTSQISTSEGAVENGGSEDEEVANADNDPYFEPVVPLPDIVDTRTGEEDEKIIFQERAKLFRYDEELKQWKERGVGDLKLLYHPTENSYRLLLRREQVHKVVLNQRLTPSFTLQPLSSSKNSLCWFGMNFSEENNTSVLEKLAARFKSEEMMSRFEKEVTDCVSKLQANEVVGDSRVNEIYSAEHEYIGGADTDENNHGCRQDDFYVEEYVEHQDYVDEQGIEDAMQDVNESENEIDTLFESPTTLQILDDDITVEYVGVVKICAQFYADSDALIAFVSFSSAEVPSLYTADITKETIIIHDGDSITFPIMSETGYNSRAVFRFENENLFEKFYDTVIKLQSCDNDSTKFCEDPA